MTAQNRPNLSVYYSNCGPLYLNTATASVGIHTRRCCRTPSNTCRESYRRVPTIGLILVFLGKRLGSCWGEKMKVGKIEKKNVNNC